MTEMLVRYVEDIRDLSDRIRVYGGVSDSGADSLEKQSRVILEFSGLFPDSALNTGTGLPEGVSRVSENPILYSASGHAWNALAVKWMSSEPDALKKNGQALGTLISRIFQRHHVPVILPGGRELRFDGAPLIMGILNVTPDSFSDGGLYFDPDRAVDHALAMAEAGADIIDVGGESTRPGAESVEPEEEEARVEPVVRAIVRQSRIPVSVDTTRSRVARAAMDAGAAMINDISGFRFDRDILSVAVESGAPVIAMHIRGVPRTMQDNPVYDDLMQEIIKELEWSILQAERAGIPRSRVIADPGIGFGKAWHDNYTILRRLDLLRVLGCPLLLGVSRKSFIGKVQNNEPHERLMGTAGAVAAAVLKGAHIVRVHDVREMFRMIRVLHTLIGENQEPES